MKPICNESSINQTNNNWLGFFLSAPTMEREADHHHHHQTQPFSHVVSGAVPFSFSSSFNYPGTYYGVEGENAAFDSPLTMLPLNGQDLVSYHQESNLQLPSMADDWMTNWVSRNSTPNVDGINVEESGAIGSLGHGDSQSLNKCMTLENKKRKPEKVHQKQIVRRKSTDTFGQRTSQYRGVTRHRWTGRYEAHLWDNSCKKEGQSRKGRQVYLGGYDMEEKAARAYDLAALKYWGFSSHINFAVENYEQELEFMNNMSRQEYVAHLRRKSSGFSRGASIYRGVTRHHQHGRWQARIGRVAGNKDLYLGTFSTQEEAAEAYDVAAIKFRGANAVTNFVTSRYDVERITASDTLLSGDMARRREEEVVNSSTNAKDIKVNSRSNGYVGNSSLSSSREGSPIISDRENGNGDSMQFELSNELLPFGVNSNWIPSPQMLPVFYAWADAS